MNCTVDMISAELQFTSGSDRIITHSFKPALFNGDLVSSIAVTENSSNTNADIGSAQVTTFSYTGEWGETVAIGEAVTFSVGLANDDGSDYTFVLRLVATLVSGEVLEDFIQVTFNSV